MRGTNGTMIAFREQLLIIKRSCYAGNYSSLGIQNVY